MQQLRKNIDFDTQRDRTSLRFLRRHLRHRRRHLCLRHRPCPRLHRRRLSRLPRPRFRLTFLLHRLRFRLRRHLLPPSPSITNLRLGDRIRKLLAIFLKQECFFDSSIGRVTTTQASLGTPARRLSTRRSLTAVTSNSGRRASSTRTHENSVSLLHCSQLLTLISQSLHPTFPLCPAQ